MDETRHENRRTGAPRPTTEGQGAVRVLSPEQKAAVEASDGPVVVEAGPGAGKTTVLTRRVHYLRTQKNVSADHIYVVTFTTAAARELQARLAALAGADNRGRVWAGTIHGLAWGLLRRAGLAGWTVVREHEQRQVVRRLLQARRVSVGDETPADVITEMSAVRNRMQRPEEHAAESVAADAFHDVAAAYRRWKQEARRLDYDDMLVRLYVLLTRRADAFHGRFPYILVDEFQDTSLLQYNILRLLAKPAHNLYVVGDVDQSIYGWRGAGPEVMLQFRRDYPGAAHVVLGRNYRAGAALVAATNKLIEHNETRAQKRIDAHRSGGRAPRILAAGDDAAEAGAVAGELVALHEAGVPWHEMAVIYRNNYQSLPFIAEFTRRRLPFRILGEPPNPFRHWVGGDVLAYVRLALGAVDEGLLERIIYRPNRYISRQASRGAARRLARGAALTDAFSDENLHRGQKQRVRELEEKLGQLGTMEPAEAIAFIRFGIDYEEYIAEQTDTAARRRTEARAIIALLQTIARGHTELGAFARLGTELQQWGKGWWQQLLAAGEVAADFYDEAGITLTTCHSAKGLEFDAVAVTGLAEGVLPAEDGDLEEERRLLYVAMTRARDHLLLSRPGTLLGQRRPPSPFIADVTG